MVATLGLMVDWSGESIDNQHSFASVLVAEYERIIVHNAVEHGRGAGRT